MSLTYTCSACGGKFESGWSDDEADAEAADTFMVPNAHLNPNMRIVCDDCYKRMNAQIPMQDWAKRHRAH